MKQLGTFKCNKINTQACKFLQNSSAAWYCIKSSEEKHPFLNISNKELFETNQAKSIKFKVFTQKKFSLLHFDELLTLMAENKLNFDFLGISETRLKLRRNSLHPISMPGYNTEHTPTESSNGGPLFYIKQGINYKLRKDLQIYKSKELESTFVEMLEPGMSKNAQKKLQNRP